MLAEWSVAGKRTPMRRFPALLLLSSLALVVACRPQPQGAVKAIVIGGEPKIRDPALGPLAPEDAVLLQNVAQGLVRFDGSGNIVGGLAERWNVSDDGLSYIFRLASMSWPDGKKITAPQIAKLLKRQLAARSRNPIKDSLGAVQDVVAMTDRVIEIQLVAPRPNLLSLLAQPELAVLRDRFGTGPFTVAPSDVAGRELRLTRQILASDDEEATQREEVLFAGASATEAVRTFADDKVDLVLGGTFADLPLAQRAKLPRNALRFDPASGLFGLIPTHTRRRHRRRRRPPHARPGDSTAPIISARWGYRASRPARRFSNLASMECPTPVAPAWFGAPFGDRLPALRAQSDRLFGKNKPDHPRHCSRWPRRRPSVPGTGSRLGRDWPDRRTRSQRVGRGFRPDRRGRAFLFPCLVCPPFPLRHRPGLRCAADELTDAARQTPIPAQRYALIAQAAARIDDAQLFIPITAPIRWSLVSSRIQGFAGNRYARHTLTDLEQQPGTD